MGGSTWWRSAGRRGTYGFIGTNKYHATAASRGRSTAKPPSTPTAATLTHLFLPGALVRPGGQHDLEVGPFQLPQLVQALDAAVRGHGQPPVAAVVRHEHAERFEPLQDRPDVR